MLRTYQELVGMTMKRCLHVKYVKVWSKKAIVHAHIVAQSLKMKKRKLRASKREAEKKQSTHTEAVSSIKPSEDG